MMANRKPTTAITRVVHQLFRIIDERGLKYANIADRVGITTATMSHWKTGKHEARVTDFELLCNELGYDLILIKRRDSRELDRIQEVLDELKDAFYERLG